MFATRWVRRWSSTGCTCKGLCVGDGTRGPGGRARSAEYISNPERVSCCIFVRLVNSDSVRCCTHTTYVHSFAKLDSVSSGKWMQEEQPLMIADAKWNRYVQVRVYAGSGALRQASTCHRCPGQPLHAHATHISIAHYTSSIARASY